MRLSNSRVLKIIFLCILINSFVYQSFDPNGLLRIFIVALMWVSMVLLVYNFFKLFLKVKISSYFRILFVFLMFWVGFLFFKSLKFDPEILFTMFGHYYFGFGWFLPLAFVFGSDLNNFLNALNLFKVFLISGILFFCLYLLNIISASGLLNFFYVLPITLLVYPYIKYKKLLIVSLFILGWISVILSTRINILLFVLIMLCMLFIKFFKKDVKSKFIAFFVSFMILFCSILSFNFTKSALLSNKELTTDTRTFLITEMFNDFSNQDLILGRGVLGTYYSPYFKDWNNQGFDGGDSSTRSVNEIGYLHIILKGGYILLLLHLLILIPAAYLGIKKSNNIISKASGYYILIYLILSLLSYPPKYSIEFLILWFAVGITITRTSRLVKDEEILIITTNNEKIYR